MQTKPSILPVRHLLPGSPRIWLLAALLACVPLQAQSKLGIIDLKKVFDGYWKTKQADAQIKERAADLDKARKGMIEDYQKAVDEHKKLVEQGSDQAVSAEERDKRKSAADKKLLEIKEIEQSINLFDRNSRETLANQQRRMREKLLGEIRELIDAKAKAGGYHLVIDVASETPNQTPVVLYHNGQNDLTPDVLAQLNANAPAVPTRIEDDPGKPADPAKPDKP